MADSQNLQPAPAGGGTQPAEPIPPAAPAPGARKPARTVHACPKCGVSDVRPSHPRGIFDRVMAAFGRAPFRCRSCWSRFFAYSPESLRALEQARLDGKAPR